MRTIALTFLSIFSFVQIQAQTELDSIFTTSEVLAVIIKSVDNDNITYVYPGEELVNTISKAGVDKIKYKSGRTEVLSASSSYRTVKNGMDWEYVTVVQVEGELKGLTQLDQVNSKAKAATNWGSVGKMETRAKRKLLIETGMNGGNVVFLTQQSSSTRTQNTTSSSVLGGVAYTNRPPNAAQFDKMMAQTKTYKYIEYHSLGANDDDMKVSTKKGESVTISSVEKQGVMIYVTATVPGISENKFRVSYFDNNQIILVYRGKKSLNNIILSK